MFDFPGVRKFIQEGTLFQPRKWNNKKKPRHAA